MTENIYLSIISNKHFKNLTEHIDMAHGAYLF